MAKIRFGPTEYNLAVDKWGADRIPKAAKQIAALARQLFPPPQTPLNGLRNFDQCGEIRLARLLAALRQATPAVIAGVQSVVDECLGDKDEDKLVRTEKKFAIYAGKGTSVAELGSGAVATVIATAFDSVLGVCPDWHIDAPIEIHFADFGRLRGMTAKDKPIFLNFPLWSEGSERFRKALVAHELFHHLQYRFGFRRGDPGLRYAWFSEGTAAWMEHACGGALTNPRKLTGTSSHPGIGLLNSSYYSFPFWLEYCRRRGGGMLDFLTRYDRSQDAEVAAANGSPDLAGPYTDSLTKRLAGVGLSRSRIWVADVRVEGAGPDVAVTDLRPELRWQQLRIARVGGSASAVGCLPRYGAQVYEVVRPAGDLLPLSAQVTEPLQVERLPGARDLYVVRAIGAAPKEEYPYTFSVRPVPLVAGGRPVGVRPPIALTTERATIHESETATVELDGFGNVLITIRKAGTSRTVIARSVVGFQAGAGASISNDDLASPAQYVSWGQAGRPTMRAGRAVVSVKSLTGTAGKITREVTNIRAEARLQFTITTKYEGTINSYEALILSSGARGSTIEPDGEGPPGCEQPAGRDCDADTRPVFFLGFGVEGKVAAWHPMVPYAGKAILPVPAELLSANGIAELYSIPL